MNGETIAETRVAESRDLGMCGCGQPRSQNHGRCWYKRSLEGKRRSNGGGQAVTAVTTKRAYVRKPKATVGDRVREGKAAFKEAYGVEPADVVTTETCTFSITITRPGCELNFTGTTVEGLKRVLEML